MHGKQQGAAAFVHMDADRGWWRRRAACVYLGLDIAVDNQLDEGSSQAIIQSCTLRCKHLQVKRNKWRKPQIICRNGRAPDPRSLLNT
jgi:hypothetical protein